MGSKDEGLQIAIIGGGIAGLSLAIALHHRGVNFKIYEQAHHFGEIGAGVSFTPNATDAMEICHPEMYDAFEKVCTRNLWPSKQKVWFDFYDGWHHVEDPRQARPCFTTTTRLGQNGVHRARFLDELVKLIPKEVAEFGKKLDIITKNDDGRLTLKFLDGSEDTVDAVIGCDGIKSRVRQILLGKDHPSAHPSYSYKYAYRALVPMEDAIKAIGEAQAQNACMHMGPGSHVLTFPVNHGQIVNVVGFHTTDKDWPDFNKLTAPSTREAALHDFEGYGPTVRSLLTLAKSDLDMWAIFDLGKHPCPTYAKGNICISGDAAHATSPHHGAGAGMCIEDSAALAEMLADENVKTRKDLEAVFTTFDAIRRERTQWLVQSSRFIGDTYEWRAPGVGDDIAKVEAEINRRKAVITDFDVRQMCQDAKQELHTNLTR